jgi:hypothetical protein
MFSVNIMELATIHEYVSLSVQKSDAKEEAIFKLNAVLYLLYDSILSDQTSIKVPSFDINVLSKPVG